MKKFLKALAIALLIGGLVGSSVFLFLKNRKLNESYEAATMQVTELQSKLNAIGQFADVYTVKAPVKMGQQIAVEDLVMQTLPVSSVPDNAVMDINKMVGNYYRIGLNPGVTLTTDFIVVEEYEGSVYDRDLNFESLPVGLKAGDYVDIRVVLPGGEEFVVFNHKRVNAKYDKSIKMKFDEAELWLYTSMMIDNSLYKEFGLKVYCTKYVDPGSHDKTVAYYPVRKEVTDIMNINQNLTVDQRNRMWNADLRNAIDKKLEFYANPENSDSGKIAAGNSQEHGLINATQDRFESASSGGSVNGGTGLQDPNNPNSSTESDSNIVGSCSGDTYLGTLTDTPPDAMPTNPTPTTPSDGNGGGFGYQPGMMDGVKDPQGNTSVIGAQDYLDSLGDNLFDDETIIE